MQKHNKIFYSFHTLYRLIASFHKIEDFSVGMAKLYSNVFRTDATIIICKSFNASKLLKVKLQDNELSLKKGGTSILSKGERNIFKGDTVITLDNQMTSQCVFLKTSGLVCVKRKKGAFSEMERKWFLAISEQMSVALKIVELYVEQKKIMLGYIEALSELLNKEMPSSSIHYKALSRLIKGLGKNMDLSDSEIKSIELASVLHDAGKIGLPKKILKKREPLTEDEFKIIKKHTKKGVELIKDVNNLRPVIPIILHHHEHYDGKGYPSKLRKEAIPLGARVLSVIDAFDAMFFGRPYKQKMSLEGIENELSKKAGAQFDPYVVKNFLKLLKRKNIKKYLNSL